MNARFQQSKGSALILTVVLTSLLAIVGVLFLMATRIDRMASSASVDNRELTFAVDSIVARISEELAEDVPRVSGDPNEPAVEYYDYPDAADPWLADLEPYRVPDPNAASAVDISQFYWRQISDVTGSFRRLDVENVPVKPSGRTVIEEYPRSDLVGQGQMADADGDGIADSRWVQWDGLTSSKGKPIYAAIRVVDNGGMLNVNTAYGFDPTAPAAKDTDVDGHTQLHVNLGALGSVSALPAAADPNTYEKEVIWNYGLPDGGFVPFDISDELELRYRYCINVEKIRTRVEAMWAMVGSGNPKWPYDASTDHGLQDWCQRISGAVSGGGLDRRHLLTTYNMDRILTPKPVSTGAGADPNRMVNVNTADENGIAKEIEAALDDLSLAGISDPAQIVANLLDYIDDDYRITVRPGQTETSAYYGFEPPCVYISELAYRGRRDPDTNDLYASYAIELYKPYFEDPDPDPNEWRLTIDNPGTPADNDPTEFITWSGTRRFDVLLAEDSRVPLQSDYVQFRDPEDPATYSQASVQTLNAAGFSDGATIELQRKVYHDLREEWLTVDRKTVPVGWMTNDGTARSLQRDISPGKCIFRLWAPVEQVSTPSLGNATGNFMSGDPRRIQAHPANRPLRNIGELGMVFAWSAYGIPEKSSLTPEEILIDLRDPIYGSLLNYLTVMDPAAIEGASPNETRIKGRININTAPAFVLGQLPWMQYRRYDPNAPVPRDPLERARAIVDYRNKNGAFHSTAGLMQVPQMCELAFDGIANQFGDVQRGPDVTPDNVLDDMEERDLLFTRVSDLVTVRSDVFTAYILVRIGANGPQRRVVAILDRSQVHAPGDPVRLVALQQVPDPR